MATEFKQRSANSIDQAFRLSTGYTRLLCYLCELRVSDAGRQQGDRTHGRLKANHLHMQALGSARFADKQEQLGKSAVQ